MPTKFIKENSPPPEMRRIDTQEALLLLAIGTFEKTTSDLTRQVAINRSTLRDKLLLLTAKGMVKETQFGWIGTLTGTELQKLSGEVEEKLRQNGKNNSVREKNIEGDNDLDTRRSSDGSFWRGGSR